MRALITTDTVGGVWRFTHELAAGLLEAGDSVALVSFGQAASPGQSAECAELASRWGLAFRYVDSDVPLEWMQHNDRCFEAGDQLIGAVAQEFDPDVLHSNQFCYGALEIGVPKIVTAHSDVLSWARACRGETLQRSPWLERYCALVQQGLDKADAVTTPTQWMLRALKQGFRVSCESRAIPNGRKIANAVPGNGRRMQAVTAGRLWDEAKGVTFLEKVTSPMQLVIAGATDCDGSTAPELKNATLVGPQSERELLRLFRESAVYVCTSRYEPFGLAPLEAALCGCAVVARRIESLEEVWGDAASYFRNAEDLSDMLAWLWEDCGRLRMAQQRAAERASRYTRAAMVASYRALYSSVAETASVT
ncbi:glycosyltransferase family 4 protein [Occallatibacter riparius]|uniref:Glycosyltransferase family 4 protein n=1 Tax=Occallatibacter riparius TaxID=1002689 RepID=A0A9J7BY16_9BACT|nr:glycosyltransferase family 4 protein [Occallatibacter riparius]UWZ86946.1 glycosyltransferase family 4 protein [Occallatibacter riparius]